jgi:two-component system, NtrC family, sensor kinase
MKTEATFRVLTVDDTPALHDDYRKIFGEDMGNLGAFRELESSLFGDTSRFKRTQAYELMSSLQGEKAVEMVKEALACGRPFSLAFVDMRMPPGWDGLQTIEELWKVDPALQIVLCSAYSDYTWDDIRRRIGNSDNLAILKKPFDNIEVYQLGYALTRKWELARQVNLKMDRLNQLVAQQTQDLREANQNLQREVAGRVKIEEGSLLAEPNGSNSRLSELGQLSEFIQLGQNICEEFRDILKAINASGEHDRARIASASERGLQLAEKLLALTQSPTPTLVSRTSSEPKNF